MTPAMLPTPEGHPKRLAFRALQDVVARLAIAATALHDAQLHELECAADKLHDGAARLVKALGKELR